jgi:hypothetical protein
LSTKRLTPGNDTTTPRQKTNTIAKSYQLTVMKTTTTTTVMLFEEEGGRKIKREVIIGGGGGDG